jgi:hypothetical protein
MRQPPKRNDLRPSSPNSRLEVLETKRKVSKSSGLKKRSKVLETDAGAYGMADFCDLVALAHRVDLLQFEEIQPQLERQAGPMHEMLMRLRESQFSCLVEKDPELPKTVVTQLNAATLFTILELRRELNKLGTMRKAEETKKTKARADGTGKRQHKTLSLYVPGHLPSIRVFVSVVAIYAGLFEVRSDGVPHLVEQVSKPGILRDRFFELLDGKVNLALLRTCAHRKCARIFYAARKDQLCCSPRHTNARGYALWYAEHGKSAVE